MYIIAQHRVTDPDFFFADIPAVASNAPAGLQARQFCPSQDKTTAVCLWEADSIDALRGYLDSVTGTASDNTYFPVSNEHAIGLPEARAASTQ